MTEGKNDRGRTPAVKSADRALLVLEHIAASPHPCSLAEMAQALAIPRSSLHGLLHNLAARGWLTAADSQGVTSYRIGPQALTVGASYLQHDDIVSRSGTMLDRLSSALRETVHIGVIDQMEVIYLAKRDAVHNLRLVSDIGVRLPAYATALGKVLLASLSEEDLARRLAYPRRYLTPRTLVDERDLRADLDATRERGYAVDDGESTEGVRCFAVPLGKQAPYTHAVSCSIPIPRLTESFEQSVINTLFEATAGFTEPSGIRLMTS